MKKEEQIFATYISSWPQLQARTSMGSPLPKFQFGVSGLVCDARDRGFWGKS